MNNKLKIFAIPYAGGSAAIYNDLKKSLPEEMTLIPIELPGHGRKFSEPCLSDIKDMAKYVLKEMLSEGIDDTYYLLGYSMGCRICYEVYILLTSMLYQKPAHMILCSSDIPHHKETRKKVAEMSDQEFDELVFNMGGTDRIILEDQELREFFLPIIKTDYIALDNYAASPIINKIACPYSLVLGSEELTKSDQEFDRWSEYFVQEGKKHIIPGGHFFITTQVNMLADIICGC